MLPSMSWWNEKEMRLFLSTNVFIYYTRESAAVDIVGITWASLGSSWRIPTTGCKRQLSCPLLKKIYLFVSLVIRKFWVLFMAIKQKKVIGSKIPYDILVIVSSYLLRKKITQTLL